MFPPQAPLDKDVDFGFLAGQFTLAGGDIRNVALSAAFLAAQDGKVVRMEHLIRAMARQMVKQGKIPSSSDFKQYHPLIGQGE
jgi:ATP-dependent 26S proteasome regulatory subunit